MEALTVTFPAIPVRIIAQLTETEAVLAETEADFVRTLREKYGDLARHNGTIKISHYGVSGSKFSDSGDRWLEADGRKVRGLLAFDAFGESFTSHNEGAYTGEKLYLAGGTNPAGGWVEIARHGRWTRWLGSPSYWTCDGSFANGRNFVDQEDRHAYGVRWMTEYDVERLAERLAKSLTDLAAKLPERLAKKRALATTLADAVEAMKRTA